MRVSRGFKSLILRCGWIFVAVCLICTSAVHAKQKSRKATPASSRKGSGFLSAQGLKGGKLGDKVKRQAALKKSKPASKPAARSAAASARGRTSGTTVGTPQSWDQVGDAPALDMNIDFKKPPRGTKISFNLVDVELIDLIKLIGNISGKNFIIGGKVNKRMKATIFAPRQITAEEAYKAFLAVLRVNGLAIVPTGRYLRIVQIQKMTQQNTPIIKGYVPNQEQVVTRIHRLNYVSGDELTSVLDRFKSTIGDITVYAPTNTLIITDFGTTIKRLLKLVKMLDVEGTSERIWIEPVNYADAKELADRIKEIFDISKTSKKGAQKKPVGKAKKGKAAGYTGGVDVVGSEESVMSISKIIPDDRTNSLIIVSSESAYLRILELVKVLDVPIAGEGTLHVHKLQHSDSTELAKTLSKLTKQGGKGKKKGAKKGDGNIDLFEGEMQIAADKATNSLVIVSSLRDYVSLKGVIETLDVMQRQVFVEAVIMEVALDKNRKFGLGVHGGNTLPGGDGLWYGISQPPGGPNSIIMDPASLTGLAAGLRGPEIEGSADIVGFSIPAFGVALQALQQNSDVNILSTPHILATDNVAASISVGENVPVLQGVNPAAALLSNMAGGQAGGAAASLMSGGLGSMMSSYSRQNVGITLKVTPHINDDNQVRLEIDLEISSVKSVDPTSGPTIMKENAATTSVVGDQQTVVIGGLITDNEVVTTTKTPVLGDIPVLGMLFRHKASQMKKRNLIIFLTPYIIRDANDFKAIFERKMAERREFIERYTAFEHHRYDPYLDWSRTNGAVAVVNKVVSEAEEDERLRKLTEVEEIDDHGQKKSIFENMNSGGSAADTGDTSSAAPIVVESGGVVAEVDTGDARVEAVATSDVDMDFTAEGGPR